MPQLEKYPWSLLVEVGDYFCVPTEVKDYRYMSMLVTQRNYRFGHTVRHITAKTTYGTIVMLAQVGEEIPPHEFKQPDGILASTSRRHLIEARSQPPSHEGLGEKPIVAPRTQQQIVNAMHWDVRNHNLPWWYDPKKGTLVVNPEIIRDPEAELFYKKQFNPGPETPYPEQYNLGPDLLIRSTPVQEDEEEEWGDQTFEPSGEGDDREDE
jgi:hypothetical protein